MKRDIRSRTSSGAASSGGERNTSGTFARPSGIHLSKDTTPATAAVERQNETVTLAGRKLSSSEFNAAMIHFYRGEVQRSNTWRNRLDTTTNWAVLTAGATLSFAFSAPGNPHFVIPINSLLVVFFLFMEARRYRYYEIWASRVRMLETGYFSQLLKPEATLDQEWAAHLSDDLKTPHFTISEWEALGRRLRRNYLWIFGLLAASWNLKIYLHPEPAQNFDEFLARAAIGTIPGGLLFIIGVFFNAVVLAFAFGTVRLREATGEVLPQHEFPFHPIQRVTNLTRAARLRRTAERRTQRARERVRTVRTSGIGATTGEWRRQDLDEIHRADLPETSREKTVVK
ncbi:hypothetical protein BH18ACI2_BH18ACI2_23200 [soil metagenome]